MVPFLMISAYVDQKQSADLIFETSRVLLRQSGAFM